MKPLIFKIIFITCFINSFALMAASPRVNHDVSWSIKFRTAYFRPTDKEVRRIYSEGWADYQLELSKIINNNWEAWGSIGGYKITGHSCPCDVPVTRDKTSLSVIPLSLGLKYYFPLPILGRGRFYLGAGGSVAFVQIKDDSEFVKKYRSENGAVGGIVKSGIQYNFKNNAFFDVFADYVFQPVHFDEGPSNVASFKTCLSGLKIGLGLGIYY